MAVEDIGNFALSTLAAPMTAGATALQLQAADAGKFPSAAGVPYRIVVITNGVPEVMLVTAGQGTANLTVTRQYETGGGLSNAVAHNAGDLVGAPMTRGGQRNLYPVKIRETVLAGSQPSITFPGLLAEGFSDLEIVGQLRNDSAVVAAPISLQFNADTGTNYSDDHLYADNLSAAVQHAYTSSLNHVEVGICAWSAANAGSFTPFRSLVKSYTDTAKWKQVVSDLSSHIEAGGSFLRGPSAGVWRSLAAIDSIKIFSSGNLVAGSRIVVWGRP